MAEISDLIARPPTFDYRTLADPFQGYMQGRDMRSQIAAQEALKQGVPRNPDGSPNYGALADQIAKSGNLGAFKTAVDLNSAEADRAWQRKYQGGMLDIARQQATRREEPEEIRKLRAAGMEPTSPEGRKALFPRTDTPISATDKKAIFEAEDAVPQLQGTIENLSRALDLNEKTFVGMGAGARGTIGANLPDWLVPDALADKKSAVATQEWSKIMGPEALQVMANSLKGATTDFELRKFIEMLGDPATDPNVRKSVIERMKKLAERRLELQNARMKDLRGGTYFGGPVRPATPQAPPAEVIAQAKAAIAAGAPREAVIQRLKENYGITGPAL